MKNSIIPIVFKKEIKDLFRDKKTILVNVLLPLILFPIMFFVIGKSVDNTTEKVKNNLKVAFSGNVNSSIVTAVKSQPNVKIIDSSNLEQDVKDGKILAGIIIPKDADEKIQAEKNAQIKIIYDDSSQQSDMAQSILRSVIDNYSKVVVSQRLKNKKIDPDILTPVNIEYKTVSKNNTGTAVMMLSMMLPLLLLIYCITGPMAPAIDLGAGEKERGTLEPLLTTQAGRLSLLWGKFLAITVVGILSIISAMAGIIISMNQKNSLFNMEGQAGGINISLQAVTLIAVLTILMIMVFGALELSISIYARSFKEAQTYLTPLNIIAIIPIYATYMLDAKNIENYYFSIPLANCVCLIKEFINGIFNYTHIGITFGWIGIYIIASLLFSRYMFNREEVIFRT